MRGERLELAPTIEAGELHPALEEMLNRKVVHVDRRVSQYCSSFMLEELDVTLADGGTLDLLLKDLGPGSLFGGAMTVKPSFIYDPEREIETYRRILSRHEIGTPRCHGAVICREKKRFWLLLERVAPEHLWMQGDFAQWTRTAAWLAGMHARFQKSIGDGAAAHLLHYGREYYMNWMRRACEFVSAGDTTPGRAAVRAIERIASRYETVVERLCALPLTVIHGEFFASNVLLNSATGRVCPVDWELAAIGPGYVDLAAMSAGNWTREQKNEMALAYHAAMPAAGLEQPSREEFLSGVECARLQQAVQWLGWSPGWSPPPEHAQDWLRDAGDSAQVLGL